MYDTINKQGKYTQKVRRLGEFHPVLKERLDVDGQDIDDPLYGNEGGDIEKVGALEALKTLPVASIRTDNMRKEKLPHDKADVSKSLLKMQA